MSWRVVARREAMDLRRSRGFWSLLVLSVVIGVAAVLLPAVAIGDGLAAERALVFLVAPLKLVVVMTGLLAGYSAVAGPRAGGQLKLVLGLPIDRTALVFGAFVGRASIVLAGTAVALGVVLAALLVVHGTIPLRPVLGFGALLGLLAVSITGLAVGLSAASASPRRAVTAAIGSFVLFEFFWGVVPASAHYLIEGSLPGAVVPPWVVLLERLQPLSAFDAATDLVLPAVHEAVRLSPEGAQAAEQAGHRPLADRLAGSPPVYLDPWAGVLTLAGWMIAPLVAGVHRFRRADL